MARKPYANPDSAVAITSCRASTGPNGDWTDGNRVESPYVIQRGARPGWEVIGRINGCPWYVTKAIDDPSTLRGFRTWRDAFVAVCRLYPGAATVLRTSGYRIRERTLQGVVS